MQSQSTASCSVTRSAIFASIAFSLEIPHADGMSDLEDRLDVIEEKLDACLILLKKATTHDSFTYSLNDKTVEWISAMRRADHLASRVALSSTEQRQDSGLQCHPSNQRPSTGPAVSDTSPIDTESMEATPTPIGR
jgi:hypothetical protein